ncbi:MULTISPECIES: response regulator [Dehalococcoides]|jgi:CheY-like chemotaxis protein|uniref:Response regulator n=2 Tax=Dehalococcoides mccartyi TaxID=61435 RepID=D2BG61_DEHMV|nr:MULTISPECIES: response regulator [Dehalococcoides]ACZ61311.1 response regulator [Dehalococcoides mccartyi VS]AHB12946.1 DNA-binding response regulator [Dehalococcoides mccartyi GY50]QYY58549.1 response regulator [Dehalococcoides mccartyi]BAQ34074.1 putative response regulator [Dehalococcoides sp. UCH007]
MTDKKYRVLVVEDEPSICQVCLRTLEGMGLEVTIAINGQIGQALIQQETFDLCLVDIRTPIMNGKNLYAYALNHYPDIAKRIIFTTGDLMDETTQGFLDAAGQPFLPKPFTPSDLKKIITETLGKLENCN